MADRLNQPPILGGQSEAAAAAAKSVESAELPTATPELIPTGPQAWSRNDRLALAQADPFGGSQWAVPWSDLMMVMFVLFAVLVALQMRENREMVESADHQEPFPVSVPTPTPDPTPTRIPSFEPLMRVNVFQRSQDAVRDARIDNVEILLMSDQSVKVSVQGPMFFELGEAALMPEVREFLDRLARVIGQTKFAVQVIGHTDDHPVDTEAFPSNWELSAARAARVARYLIESAGIDPRRFTVMGRAEYEPAVANRDDASRALNRRVEIIITRDEVEPAEVPEAEGPVSGNLEPEVDADADAE
ncbi:MAG: OmpA family protein [Lamprobacter sp.]|uniref:OmpA/MotB family protein n=1 Tax=Lamprobacter sp. TaxID=3100796 RepID=UPI002B261F92|nr:OmpA family protein [Lamprobacter sp.]MEA3640518.1 OmpA family protein [Lamprobacter sp.]